MSDRPNNLNLGKDFLLLWGSTPQRKAANSLAAQTIATPTGGGGTGGGGTGGVTLVDMLNWLLLPLSLRSTKYMVGTNTRSYIFINTDAAWPVGFPTNTFVWVKNVLGH